MSSPFWSALGKLDGSVDTIESQIDCLRAALEIDDAKLSQSLMQARREGALLRDLVRAERPDAKWNDRTELDMLIHDLEIAAQERRNQARRNKLMDLANELDAGKVKHRFEARSSALNALRLDAVKELRKEAAAAQQEKELPGPDAGSWLHWACNLQEGKDSQVLANLNRDFGAVERFIGEMEESYWMPGERANSSESTLRSAKGNVAESYASR
jgi:hypothetical protein